MFGPRFYGSRFYGPRYWGDGSDTVAAVTVTRRRHFAAIIASGGYGLVMWILGGL